MLFDHNWIKIIYYNFSFLPFKQAIHFPIDVAKKTEIRNKGKIIIRGPIHRGMISIGFQSHDLFGWRKTIIDNEGELYFSGDCIRIGTGTTVRICKKSKVSFDKYVCIGANSLILSEDNIVFGERATFSWNCQIMDTDTHSIVNISTNEVYIRHKPVAIGKNVWIGNHVLINKGTIIPDNTIVSSYSLCNKDYSGLIEQNCVIGGVPAKKIAENRARYNDKLM